MAEWGKVTDNVYALRLKHFTINLHQYQNHWYWSTNGTIQIPQKQLQTNLLYVPDLKREVVKQFKAYLDDVIKGI